MHDRENELELEVDALKREIARLEDELRRAEEYAKMQDDWISYLCDRLQYDADMKRVIRDIGDRVITGLSGLCVCGETNSRNCPVHGGL